MSDFFISYNKADRQWAEWIAWHLEEAGYTTTIQAWDFRPGGNFVLDMQRAGAESERVVAVLSPDYLASQFTAPEWAAAFAKDPTGAQGLLLPVRVRECEPKGLLPQIVYIDLVGVDDAEAKNLLLAGVKRGRAKPSTAPNFPGPTPRTITQPPPFPGFVQPMNPTDAEPRNVSTAGAGGIAIGGDVKNSNLVTGNHNVINHHLGDDVAGDKQTIINQAPLKVLLPILLLVAALIGYLVYHQRSGISADESLYRLRVTVTNPQNVPIEEAKVWSSMGGEPKKVSGGWQFDIPAASKPSDGKLTIFAAQENAFLTGQTELTLSQDFNPNVTIKLEHDTSAKVRGQVTDGKGRSVAGARVFVTGYEGEAMITKEGGNFELPAHAAIDQQVLVVAEKAGGGVARRWHPAGDTPVQLDLQR